MAKVYEVYGTYQAGGAIADSPWTDCKTLLDLDDYTHTEDCPKFGTENTWPIPTNIVVKVMDDEALEHGIRPGFRNSPLMPDEAKERLGLA